MQAQFTSTITAELTGHYGTDADICHAAWVSTGNEMKSEPSNDRMEKLIADLIRQKHGSPFEDGFFRFRITAPRGVRDEHVRHRIGSYSSASSRYREIPPLFYVPSAERPLKRVENFKSMRPQYETYEKERYEEYRSLMEAMYTAFVDNLTALKEHGFVGTEEIRWGNPDGQIIPYIARFNPRSLMHFLSLRTHDPRANHPSYPMWEIEEVARQCEEHFARLLPITHHWWNQGGREAP